MMPIPISNKRRILEISAVILTAAGKFVFMDYLNWRFVYVVVTTLTWMGYIIYRSKTQREILNYWGFRTDNFKKVMRKVLPFGIVSVVTFFCAGFYQGTINITWHMIPILVFYPAWGIIQQFLLIALTTGNMQDLEGKKINKGIIILVSALLFASVHYPVVWLIIATFVLAIFYGVIYLSERNIYVLGLFHGWLGGLFYYTVLNKDPYMETFGKLFHSTR